MLVEPRHDSRRIRVLHVVPSESGAAYFRGLAENFDRDRFDFHFLTLETDDLKNEPLRRLGAKTHGLAAGAGRRGLLRAAARLHAFLARETYDLIHLHLFPSLVAGGYSQLFRTRSIFLASHHYGREPFLYRDSRLAQWLERGFCRRLDHVVAVSRDIADYLREEIGIPDQRMSLVHYGFDFDARYSPDSEDARRKSRTELGLSSFFVVGAVARLHWTKGQEYLLDAAARLKREDGVDLRVLLLGTGPSENSLKARARDLGIADEVLFLGWQSDPFPYYRAMDVFCHPSLQKGYEQVTVEAMALGKAVVGTPVGIARELLRNGENGLVVEAKDSDAIYRALRTLQRDDELRRALGARAAGDVRRDVPSRREMTRSYEGLYLRLLNGSRAKTA